jgi:hypothetical protein
MYYIIKTLYLNLVFKLDFLNNFTDEFDIIAVTETHLHPNISNNDIEIDSFSKNIIRKDRNNAD